MRFNSLMFGQQHLQFLPLPPPFLDLPSLFHIYLPAPSNPPPPPPPFPSKSRIRPKERCPDEGPPSFPPLFHTPSLPILSSTANPYTPQYGNVFSRMVPLFIFWALHRLLFRFSFSCCFAFLWTSFTSPLLPRPNPFFPRENPQQRNCFPLFFPRTPLPPTPQRIVVHFLNFLGEFHLPHPHPPPPSPPPQCSTFLAF